MTSFSPSLALLLAACSSATDSLSTPADEDEIIAAPHEATLVASQAAAAPSELALQPLATNQGSQVLDATFGANGFRAFSGFTTVHSVVRLSDERTLVLGNRQFIGEGLIAVVNRDGVLDATFGAGGFVDLPGAVAHASVQPDDKILVALNMPQIDGQGNVNGNIAIVVRLRPDGAFDSSFDGDGQLTIPDTAATAVFCAGHRIHVFAGAELLRLNNDGSFDTSFDGDGRKGVPSLGVGTVVAVGLDPLSRLVVYGKASPSGISGALARLSLDGVRDESFGAGGTTTLGGFGPALNAGPNSLTFDAAGRIVTAGVLFNPSIPGDVGRVSFAVARVVENGALDPSFDADGVAVSSVGQGVDGSTSGADALGVVITPDGAITALGKVGETSQFQDYAAARWNADGSVDTSFGESGKFRFGLQAAGILGNRVERFVGAVPIFRGRLLAAFGVSGTGANGAGELTMARLRR